MPNRIVTIKIRQQPKNKNLFLSGIQEVIGNRKANDLVLGIFEKAL